MSDNHPAWRKLAFGLGASVAILCRSVLAAGGIATDGSLGPARTLSGVAVEIPQSLGRTVGANLFHSFSTFNVEAGQTVTFTGDGQLQNVVSRVTGGETSRIDGLLRSQIGQADFYLINPAGAVFGANAQIDVPAAFHVGAADRLKFADGAVFAVAFGSIGQLSGAAPAAFGFLERSTGNNGLVEIDGAQLAAHGGQTIDIAARGIQIENRASLTATGGEIRLMSIADEGEAGLIRSGGVLPFATVAPNLAGPISVSDSVVNVSGNGGGRITVQGGEILLQGSSAVLRNINTGETDAAPSTGILVQANDLTLDGGALNAGARGGSGDAAAVEVRVADKLELSRKGIINSFTESSGRAADIDVRAGQILLRGADTVIGSNSFGSGQSGNVNVWASGALEATGGAISATAYATGGAGDVSVDAGSIKLDGQGDATKFHGIFSNIFLSSGSAAGSVRATSRGALEILDGAEISSFAYFSSSNAGDVEVKAGTVRIDGKGASSRTGIYSKSYLGGKAGIVAVESAGRMEIAEGGTIQNAARGGIDVGAVNVVAGSLRIDGRKNSLTGIFSETFDNGRSGPIRVETRGGIQLLAGGNISNSTGGAGDANSVTLKAKSLEIDGQGVFSTGVFSDAYPGSAGHAGDLRLTIRGSLTLRDEGRISSDTAGSGAAGTIIVKAGSLSIVGGEKDTGSGIYSNALPGSGGQSGNLVLTARSINLSDHALIYAANNAFIDDPAVVRPGSLRIAAHEIRLADSRIVTSSGGNIDAGNIAIVFDRLECLDRSFIGTDANEGNGGAIRLSGGESIVLRDSSVKTSARGGASDGGDIRLAGDTLILATGLIQANANGGYGGNIRIDAKALIPSGDTLLLGGVQAIEDWRPGIFGYNIVQAASKAHASGVISSTAPQLNLSGILANLGASFMDVSSLSQGYCAAGTGSSLSYGGRGGMLRKYDDSQVF